MNLSSVLSPVIQDLHEAFCFSNVSETLHVTLNSPSTSLCQCMQSTPLSDCFLLLLEKKTRLNEIWRHNHVAFKTKKFISHFIQEMLGTSACIWPTTSCKHKCITPVFEITVCPRRITFGMNDDITLHSYHLLPLTRSVTDPAPQNSITSYKEKHINLSQNYVWHLVNTDRGIHHKSISIPSLIPLPKDYD